MKQQTLIRVGLLLFIGRVLGFQSFSLHRKRSKYWRLLSVSRNADSTPEDEPVLSTIQTEKELPKVLQMSPLVVENPDEVKFVESHEIDNEFAELLKEPSSNYSYPFAMMLSGSAPYIAAHRGETIVFHLPGDYLESSGSFDSLLSDIALSRVLGMKIVMVIGCRYDLDSCDLDLAKNAHECFNSLKVTDSKTLRLLQEEVGYMRTELERKLNRFMRSHAHGSGAIAEEGNVIGGNFYTAHQFGKIGDKDFKYTGYAPTQLVDAAKIRSHLANDDVVLLTTVGASDKGDLVSVNGYHLAASVAAALKAYKVVYLANQGSLMKTKHGVAIQEIPLSFVKKLTDFHQVEIHKSGYATFSEAAAKLEAHAVELLLHLGWASWALEKGVTRAHIVNPGDGSILEELFTSKNGANTCLYNDDEVDYFEAEVAFLEEDFEEFLKADENQV